MNSKTELKTDLAAGFSVALVALPLSIGIALASGAPASSGLIAAIIGGLLGSWMGGAHVTINGPAAGLIVIVLDATIALGFRGMLGAAVVSGALQVIMGGFKFGRKGTAFPASVIHGMMAAIGIIIIAKQMHILIGHTPVAKNPIMLLLEIPISFTNVQPMVLLVGALTLFVLIAWNKVEQPLLKKIPGPLVGVILGGFLANMTDLNSNALLNVPSDLGGWIIFPDFSVMSTSAGWKAAITLALVGSLETILSATAVDKIDPLKRKTNLDRDLVSKGICNLISSSIGGIPMIAEIVRSSANVSYGARSWKSNFFHGALILLAVLFLPKALNLVPLSSLAAILVMIGWRLGNPKHFQHAMEIGRDNVVGFAVTMLVTLMVDLLVGIACGALAQYLVEVFLGLKVKNSFRPEFSLITKNEDTLVTVKSSLIFSNFSQIKDEVMRHVEARENIKIDLRDCEYIDHSVIEQIHELKSYCESQGITLVVDISNHHPLGHSISSSQKKVS